MEVLKMPDLLAPYHATGQGVLGTIDSDGVARLRPVASGPILIGPMGRPEPSLDPYVVAIGQLDINCVHLRRIWLCDVQDVFVIMHGFLFWPEHKGELPCVLHESHGTGEKCPFATRAGAGGAWPQCRGRSLEILACLGQSPPDGKDLLRLRGLAEHLLHAIDEALTLLIHLVLCLKHGPAHVRALAFEPLDALLGRELLRQRRCTGGGPPGFPDLAVQILDLAFEAKLDVISPAIELDRLGLEEAGIAFIDRALDGGLLLCEDILECLRRGACAGAARHSRKSEQA